MQLALPLEAPPQSDPPRNHAWTRRWPNYRPGWPAPTAGLGVGALLDAAATRLEVVITFMAVLELLRRHAILAVQDTTFRRDS